MRQYIMTYPGNLSTLAGFVDSGSMEGQALGVLDTKGSYVSLDGVSQFPALLLLCISGYF